MVEAGKLDGLSVGHVDDRVSRDHTAASDAPLARPAIPPKRLMQAFYTSRREHGFRERLDFDLLFRWVGGDERRSVRPGSRWRRKGLSVLAMPPPSLAPVD